MFIDLIGIILLGISLLINNNSYSKKRFILLVHFAVILGLILFFDGIGWLVNGKFVFLGRLLSFAVILLEPFLAAGWCAYIRSLINPEKKYTEAFFCFMIIPIAAVIIFAILNIFTGWVFIFTDDAGYVRGKLFWIFYVLYTPHLLYLFYVLFANVKKINDKRLVARIIITYSFLLLAFILQICIYGIPVVFVAFSIAVIYINMDMEKKTVDTTSSDQKRLVAHTFGEFYITYGDQMVKFKRKKSLELLAYLIDKKGYPISLNQLIYDLYEKDYVSKNDRSMIHNLICDIKKTFAQLGINDFFIKEYNSCRINKDLIYCDYFEILKGNADEQNLFSGLYMTDYYWAEETCAYLTSKFLK